MTSIIYSPPITLLTLLLTLLSTGTCVFQKRNSYTYITFHWPRVPQHHLLQEQ